MTLGHHSEIPLEYLTIVNYILSRVHNICKRLTNSLLLDCSISLLEYNFIDYSNILTVPLIGICKMC